MVWNSPTSLHACECVRVYARLAGISSTGVVRLKSVIEPKWHFHKKSINSRIICGHIHTHRHMPLQTAYYYFLFIYNSHIPYTHTHHIDMYVQYVFWTFQRNLHSVHFDEQQQRGSNIVPTARAAKLWSCVCWLCFFLFLHSHIFGFLYESCSPRTLPPAVAHNMWHHTPPPPSALH